VVVLYATHQRSTPVTALVRSTLRSLSHISVRVKLWRPNPFYALQIGARAALHNPLLMHSTTAPAFIIHHSLTAYLHSLRQRLCAVVTDLILVKVQCLKRAVMLEIRAPITHTANQINVSQLITLQNT
jgi:hypothetical protein